MKLSNLILFFSILSCQVLGMETKAPTMQGKVLCLLSYIFADDELDNYKDGYLLIADKYGSDKYGNILFHHAKEIDSKTDIDDIRLMKDDIYKFLSKNRSDLSSAVIEKLTNEYGRLARIIRNNLQQESRKK